MNPADLPTERGVLHIEISGLWTPKDLAALLGDLHETYRGLNTLDFFAMAISREASDNERFYQNKEYDKRSYTFQHLFHGLPREFRNGVDYVNPTFDVLTTVAEQYSGEPLLNSINYNSPGWIEIIGSWNPLKVIADAITEWRKQNTEREKNRIDAQLEAMRIRAGLVNGVLSNDQLIREGNPVTLNLIFENILNPANEFVIGMAKDTRIISAQVLTPSAASAPRSLAASSEPNP